MAISAYDSSGRLKKHALLGTSLAVDPNRSVRRGRFQELHKEAKAGAGQGRETMTKRLTSRFKAFAKPQQDRLAQIASKRKQFEQEYEDLDDPELEKRFQQHRTYRKEQGTRERQRFSSLGHAGVPEEFLAEAKASFESEVPENIPEQELTKAQRQAIEARAYMGALQAGEFFNNTGYNRRVSAEERDYDMGRYAKVLYEKKYGEAAHTEYQKKLSDAVDRINETYIPLQQEDIDRNKRLADRMDLYNLFLGQS